MARAHLEDKYKCAYITLMFSRLLNLLHLVVSWIFYSGIRFKKSLLFMSFLQIFSG